MDGVVTTDVEALYLEAISGKELLSYVDLTLIPKVFPTHADLFDKGLRDNPDLMVREIVLDKEGIRDRASVFSKYPNFEYKLVLPEEIEISSADILIYDGKVVIVNVTDAPSAVVIDNLDYYNLSRSIFEYLWKILPTVQESKEGIR